MDAEELRALARVFPVVGEGWLAEHLGVPRELVAAGCAALGLHRVDRGELGVEWHRDAPRASPVRPARSNVIPFMRRGPTVDDGEVDA